MLLGSWMGGESKIQVYQLKNSLQIHAVGGEGSGRERVRGYISDVHLRPRLEGQELQEVGSSWQCKLTTTITEALISCWNLNILSALKIT